MSYDTRQEAFRKWVPDTANILHEGEETVTYLHERTLFVLRIFSVGSTVQWYVSVDVRITIDTLVEMSS